MGRIMVGLVVVAALFSAACAKGDDDDNVFSDLGEDNGKSDDGDGKGDQNNGGDGSARADYVEALAKTAQADDADELSLSDEGATCIAEGVIDVVGLDEIQSAVSADEISDHPRPKLRDWGIEMSADQGAEVFRRLLDCEPDAMQELAEAIAGQLTDDSSFPIDIEIDCLADADPGDIESFMGASLASSGDFDPTEDQARDLFDWVAGCADLEAAFLASIGDAPASVKACVADKVDEDDIEDLMVAAALVGEGAEMEDIPEGRAFTETLSSCTGR
jgi:hypothetical protein